MKYDHNEIELTPAVVQVCGVAQNEASVLDLGEHLGGEEQRADTVDGERVVVDRFRVVDGCRRVGAYGHEAEQGARVNKASAPLAVYPVGDRVVRTILLQAANLSAQIHHGQRESFARVRRYRSCVARFSLQHFSSICSLCALILHLLI